MLAFPCLRRHGRLLIRKRNLCLSSSVLALAALPSASHANHGPVCRLATDGECVDELPWPISVFQSLFPAPRPWRFCPLASPLTTRSYLLMRRWRLCYVYSTTTQELLFPIAAASASLLHGELWRFCLFQAEAIRRVMSSESQNPSDESGKTAWVPCCLSTSVLCLSFTILM